MQNSPSFFINANDDNKDSDPKFIDNYSLRLLLYLPMFGHVEFFSIVVEVQDEVPYDHVCTKEQDVTVYNVPYDTPTS